MRKAEIQILDEEDLVERLTDMRVWLDRHRFEPSTFTYFHLTRGMKVWVTFQADDEAEAFASKFGGFLLTLHDAAA